MPPVIELQDVWKTYQMGEVEVHAVQGVSLAVRKGEFVAIMGPSGSGKSTLLNLIGCLDVPTRGEVFLDGQPVSSLDESALARIRGQKIGFIFQMFNLYPTLNVLENVMLPMRIHDFDEAAMATQATKLLALVGLEHRLGHFPAQLSGGERQRVAIARALSTGPSLILADEPTGNVDSKVKQEIMDFLRHLHKKEGRTIVVITHEPDIAAYAERVVRLKDGKIMHAVHKEEGK